MTVRERKGLMTTLREFLDKDVIKVILSVLIIISVLPENALTRSTESRISIVFFFIFGFEFIIRAIALYPYLKERKVRFLDVVLLIFDLVATLSFLPVDLIYPPAKSLKALRLFRLMRMLLLVRYWGPVGREVWVIVLKRKFQLLFAASIVLLLSFVGGALLSNLHEIEAGSDLSVTGVREGYDYNGDGVVDKRDRRFSTMVWWSFRQIQDPGNLIAAPRGGFLFLLSLVLTVGGVFIISFIIGIGTNVVEELVAASKSRPIGMDDHSAILNVSNSSHLLLQELEKYYLKHLRKARIAVLGSTPTRPHYLYRHELSQIRYRAGHPSNVQDLQKVDVDRASRVILLGNADDPGSDASVTSQILSVRQLNPDGTILAEIFHDANLGAAAEAGGNRTVPIPMARFASLFLTNIVLFPGIEEVYRELLTSAGHEIYTVIFGEKTIPPISADAVRPMPFEDLFHIAYRHYDIILLGVMTVNDNDSDRPGSDFRPLLNPEATHVITADIKGFIGLSSGFEELRTFSLDFAQGVLPEISSGTPLTPTLPAFTSLASASGSEGQRGEMPSFRLCPDSFGCEKILISNFREGLIEFVEQLILFLRQVQIYIMVENAPDVENSIELMLAHSIRIAACGPSRPGAFIYESNRLVYRFHNPKQPVVPIRIFQGDATDERQLIAPTVGRFTIKDLDVVIFTSRTGARDPDAKTAMAMLKIWNLRRSRPQLFKSTFRMIAEVEDPDKGDLLEKRALAASLPIRHCGAYTVLSKERIRNDFLAQAIFVPGISDIYTELLSETGEEICRLLPASSVTNSGMEVTFPDLIRTLYTRDQMILIGVELRKGPKGGTEIHLNPEHGEPGFRFPLRDLIAVCAVGNTRRLVKNEEDKVKKEG